MPWPRARKFALRTTIALIFLFVGAFACGVFALWGSLPALDGEIKAQVKAPVQIDRDARGAVTINASNQHDLAFALGYAHAQDRRFQMDLLRRASAGELSELIGEATLNADKNIRIHRFKKVARDSFASLTSSDQELLNAYAEGVNAGTASLLIRPFEYILLNSVPTTWLPEDSLLVVLAMFIQLQNPNGRTKIQRGLIRDALPFEAADFVYSPATKYEATLDGTRSIQAKLPQANIYNLREMTQLNFTPPSIPLEQVLTGASNNWAVSGKRTANGSALVADDMHLQLRVPNTWYRARLRLDDKENGFDITGVTLPGTPAVVAGSNGHIAWGFTNSNGDFQEAIVLVPDPSDPNRYLTYEGSEPFLHEVEYINIKGKAPEKFEFTSSRWGPVVAEDFKGRKISLEWTAHKADAINLEIGRLQSTKSVKEALAIAKTMGIPAQNIVIGDAKGHIGWTIAGKIPRREGEHFATRLSTEPSVGFLGWLDPTDYPKIEDPESGQISTANARVLGGEGLAIIGDGGYDRGARAIRIEKQLALMGDKQTPNDMLALQLDDNAFFLAPWHKRLVALLDEDAIRKHPKRAELKLALSTFSGHAAIDDAAYSAVRAFRTQVERRLFFALIAPARALNPDFEFRIPKSFEGPLETILEEKPLHLLPPEFASYQDLLLEAVDEAVLSLEEECASLNRCTWGVVNQVQIKHPISAAIPMLGVLVNMKAASIPGDSDMPLVTGPHFGASERFGISVGHENESYFQMPTGQSGHPLSPYFRAGHEAWVQGIFEPFLPTEPIHTLLFAP